MRKDIKQEVWAVLAEDEASGTQIRVVSWNDRDPVLEKRYILTKKETGELVVGRCKGFTLEDLRLVVKRFDEIVKVFTHGDSLEESKG